MLLDQVALKPSIVTLVRVIHDRSRPRNPASLCRSHSGSAGTLCHPAHQLEALLAEQLAKMEDSSKTSHSSLPTLSCSLISLVYFYHKLRFGKLVDSSPVSSHNKAEHPSNRKVRETDGDNEEI